MYAILFVGIESIREMSVTMAQNEKRRTKKFEITRNKIITAAQQLSMQNGFTSLTVKDVCDAAGVSVGSFYNCFNSFAEMLTEADNNPDRMFAAQSIEDLDGSTATDKLFSFATHYAKLNTDTGVEDLSLLMTPSVKNTQYSRHKPMFDIVAGTFRLGQESGEFTSDYTAEQMSEMLFVTMRGCAYDWCMKGGEHDLREKTLLHVKILLHALKKF